MKNYLLCFTALLLFSFVTSGQSLSPIDTNKYSIHLPDYWRPGNKVWQILTDKLPLVCDELKGKELCGDDCHPVYTIEFEMSEPTINDYLPLHISSGSTSQTWDFITSYTFTSSLLLMNEKKQLLIRFILVDTNEIWTVTHRASLASYYPPVKKIYLDSAFVAQRGNMDRDLESRPAFGGPDQTPYDYINRNKQNLAPARKDMLAVVDKKFKAL